MWYLCHVIFVMVRWYICDTCLVLWHHFQSETLCNDSCVMDLIIITWFSSCIDFWEKNQTLQLAIVKLWNPSCIIWVKCNFGYSKLCLSFPKVMMRCSPKWLQISWKAVKSLKIGLWQETGFSKQRVWPHTTFYNGTTKNVRTWNVTNNLLNGENCVYSLF